MPKTKKDKECNNCNVKCNVDNCKNYDNGKCSLDEIEVDCTCDSDECDCPNDTACNSYESASSSEQEEDI